MKPYIIPKRRGYPTIYATYRQFSATALRHGDKYKFPAHPNPTPYEILNVAPGALASDIKKRYLELTKLYHPDTRTAQGMPQEVAYARFRAVTAAYHSLQQNRGHINESSNASLDTEAEEIKKRLATWGTASSRLSPLEKARRERALDAEKNAGKWWKTDMTLYYIFGGAALAIAIMQFQGRSTVQKERVKRYLEMRRTPSDPSPPPKHP